MSQQDEKGDSKKPVNNNDDSPKEERIVNKNVISNEQLNDMAMVLFGLFERVQWKAQEKSQKKKEYSYPFILDDKTFKQMNERINKWMLEYNPNFDQSHSFIAEIRFSDLSSMRFITLDEFMEQAGHKRDPESLRVTWSTTKDELSSSNARIEMSFATEKMLDTGVLNWFQFPLANMELKVSSSDSEWISKVFEDFDPYFKSMRIRGIYRPLLAFRNATFIHAFSWTTGFIIQQIFIEIIGYYWYEAKNNIIRQRILEKIIAETTAEEKLNIYYQYLLSPTENALLPGILFLTLAFMIFFIITIFGYMYYPKLVPRSGINIGLASVRYAEYANIFRFLVVAVGFIAIVIGGIVSLIVNLITK